jgi:hypothetical protein
MKTKTIEEILKERGYKLVDTIPPFKIYDKHKKRFVYHAPSDKVWGYFDLKNPLENVRYDEKTLLFKKQ